MVGGEFQKFEPERFEPPQRNRKDKTIEVHILIPEATWRTHTGNALRDHLAKLVRRGLELCVVRLLKDGEVVDQVSLFREVDEAIETFLAIDYEDGNGAA